MIDVDVGADSTVRVHFRSLRNVLAAFDQANSYGSMLARGDDEIFAMCPAYHDDDWRALTISLRRRSSGVRVDATVRTAKPVCPARLLIEREKEIRVARSFVGEHEGGYLAFFDEVASACTRWADGHPPGYGSLARPTIADRVGALHVAGGCRAADTETSFGG